MATIENVRNPIWANAEHTAINCEIEHSKFGWIPFSASPNDPEDHGRAIFAACESGEFGPIADYVAPPEPEPQAPDPKMVGIEFGGVMCSATSADAAGLLQVKAGIEMMGAKFKTKFQFANGSTLGITAANFTAFMQTWVPFRQSFFES